MEPCYTSVTAGRYTTKAGRRYIATPLTAVQWQDASAIWAPWVDSRSVYNIWRVWHAIHPNGKRLHKIHPDDVSPLCQCGQIDDCDHLTRCPLVQTLATQMESSLGLPSLAPQGSSGIHARVSFWYHIVRLRMMQGLPTRIQLLAFDLELTHLRRLRWLGADIDSVWGTMGNIRAG